MSKEQNVVYLSKRLLILWHVVGGVIVGLLACILGHLWFAWSLWLIFFLGIGALVFLSLFARLWFWEPSQKVDRQTALLLEGFFDDASLGKTYAGSHATHGVYLRLKEMLSPTQMFLLNKRQAQYLALQNQINPHFLYNTLESIRSEALMADLCEVADMTEALASFFRYTISKVENLVSVEEEIENCLGYFSIQQYRFADRIQLTVECDKDDQEEIYRCRLPKLTLQPLLENSIVHGVEVKMGKGHLTIKLEKTKKRLIISVSDDGAGMDEETLAKLNAKLRNPYALPREQEEKRGGLALPNVDERIRLLFGDEYGIHVFSAIGEGTTVALSLPAVTSDREIKNNEVLQ